MNKPSKLRYIIYGGLIAAGVTILFFSIASKDAAEAVLILLVFGMGGIILGPLVFIWPVIIGLFVGWIIYKYRSGEWYSKKKIYYALAVIFMIPAIWLFSEAYLSFGANSADNSLFYASGGGLALTSFLFLFFALKEPNPQ